MAAQKTAISPAAGGGDVHSDVMAQIRRGAQLKHVEVEESEKRKSAVAEDYGGIAGALARALEERRQNMGLDDDSSEEGQ